MLPTQEDPKAPDRTPRMSLGRLHYVGQIPLSRFQGICYDPAAQESRPNP